MDNLNVVFLDIDGVLCTRKAAGWTRRGKPFVKGLLIRRPVRAFDRGAIERLNTLCSENSAHVVVTSMWRIDRDVPSILKQVGFSGAFHNDWHTDIEGPTRADEVNRWLLAHQTSSFIVIDDKLQGVEPLVQHLVLVDNYHGFEWCDLDRASQMFVCGHADPAKYRDP